MFIYRLVCVILTNDLYVFIYRSVCVILTNDLFVFIYRSVCKDRGSSYYKCKMASTVYQEAWKQLLDAYGIWEQKDKQLLDFNILDK